MDSDHAPDRLHLVVERYKNSGWTRRYPNPKDWLDHQRGQKMRRRAANYMSDLLRVEKGELAREEFERLHPDREEIMSDEDYEELNEERDAER